MSGALKKWLQFQPEMMGEERRKELERINGLRKFWIFRGYFASRSTRSEANPHKSRGRVRGFFVAKPRRFR